MLCECVGCFEALQVCIQPMRMEHRTTAEAGNKGWRIQLESGEFQEVEEGEEPFCTPRMQLSEHNTYRG